MRRSPDLILVAGAGIGGLSAAVALAQAGFDVQVLERAPRFSEVGAGIQLGPNATRVLRAWGVLERLEPSVVYPYGIRVQDGTSGRLLATVPLGSVAEERYGAPYVLAHRADLHRALLEAARWSPRIAVTAGFHVARITPSDVGVVAHAPQGGMMEAPALVAADGVLSRLRLRLDRAARAVFAGRSAWRALIPAADARLHLLDGCVWLWMGPGGHLVHYPVRGGEAVNVVAVIDDDWVGEGWNAEGSAEVLLPRFARWAAPAREVLELARGWRKWALFELPPLRHLAYGPVALLGDAAHPVLPFLAQGAALAIEDAAVLAAAVAGEGGPTARALRRYGQSRLARAARVQEQSRRMGRIYHMTGAPRWARNAVLQTRSPDSLLADFDWLYGYQPPLPQRERAA